MVKIHLSIRHTQADNKPNLIFQKTTFTKKTLQKLTNIEKTTTFAFKPGQYRLDQIHP